MPSREPRRLSNPSIADSRAVTASERPSAPTTTTLVKPLHEPVVAKVNATADTRATQITRTRLVRPLQRLRSLEPHRLPPEIRAQSKCTDGRPFVVLCGGQGDPPDDVPRRPARKREQHGEH